MSHLAWRVFEGEHHSVEFAATRAICGKETGGQPVDHAELLSGQIVPTVKRPGLKAALEKVCRDCAGRMNIHFSEKDFASMVPPTTAEKAGK